VLALRAEIAAHTRPSYRVMPTLTVRHRVSIVLVSCFLVSCVVQRVVSDASGHLYLEFIVAYEGKYFTNFNCALNMELKIQWLLEML
jgi:hypothetical protein